MCCARLAPQNLRSHEIPQQTRTILCFKWSKCSCSQYYSNINISIHTNIRKQWNKTKKKNWQTYSDFRILYGFMQILLCHSEGMWTENEGNKVANLPFPGMWWNPAAFQRTHTARNQWHRLEREISAEPSLSCGWIGQNMEYYHVDPNWIQNSINYEFCHIIPPMCSPYFVGRKITGMRPHWSRS